MSSSKEKPKNGIFSGKRKVKVQVRPILQSFTSRKALALDLGPSSHLSRHKPHALYLKVHFLILPTWRIQLASKSNALSTMKRGLLPSLQLRHSPVCFDSGDALNRFLAKSIRLFD
jgi:hypothetical protein